jgi:hypothetical protein
MGSREIRVGKNEARFREINEAVERLTPIKARSIQIICECAREQCVYMLEVTRDAYEAVRQSSTEFIVCRGHQMPEFEHVVSDHGDFLVVAKVGDAGAVAEQLDPRT